MEWEAQAFSKNLAQMFSSFNIVINQRYCQQPQNDLEHKPPLYYEYLPSRLKFYGFFLRCNVFEDIILLKIMQKRNPTILKYNCLDLWEMT